MVWYISFLSTSGWTPSLLLSLLWTRDKFSLFLVQILSSALLHSPISFLSTFFHSFSFQIPWSAYGTALALTSLSLSLILLPLHYHPKSPIFPLLSLYSLFCFSFSFSSFLSLFSPSLLSFLLLLLLFRFSLFQSSLSSTFFQTPHHFYFSYLPINLKVMID